MISDALRLYFNVKGRKSGFCLSGGNGKYLYGNRICTANCELLLINSESISIRSDSHDCLLVYVSQEQNPTLTVYNEGKLALHIKEFVLAYSIPLANHEICGIISGGTEYPAQDIRFTDHRLIELFVRLLKPRRSVRPFVDKEFRELAEMVEKGELSSLNELYLAGTHIESDQ